MNNSNVFRRIPSYCVRSTKLSENQKIYWEKNLMKYGLDIFANNSTSNTEFNLGFEYIRNWFTNHSKVVVEIGCGDGVSSIKMAQESIDEIVIAIDVYKPGLIKLMRAINTLNLVNLKLIYGDAIDFLELFIPNNFLSGIRIFFPDPWPKRKHHKRRIISLANLELFNDKLQSGGVLHIATDHSEYSDYIAGVVNSFDKLKIVSENEDCSNIMANKFNINIARPKTKFETKGKIKGHRITDRIWQKI